MKTEQIIILVVAFFLGMLLLNMVKNVCGCEVEGFDIANQLARNFTENCPLTGDEPPQGATAALRHGNCGSVYNPDDEEWVGQSLDAQADTGALNWGNDEDGVPKCQMLKDLVRKCNIDRSCGFSEDDDGLNAAFIHLYSDTYEVGSCGDTGSPSPSPPAVTYDWQVGDYSPTCPSECGNDTIEQTRTVTCVDQDGTEVDDSLCDQNTAPQNSNTCPATRSCTRWTLGDWDPSQCPTEHVCQAVPATTRTRTYSCPGGGENPSSVCGPPPSPPEESQPCPAQPVRECQNGGSCNPATRVCDCPDGYSGDNCQIAPTSVDPCEGVDCGVHGTCNDGACTCNDRYTGETCNVFISKVCNRPFNNWDELPPGYARGSDADETHPYTVDQIFPNNLDWMRPNSSGGATWGGRGMATNNRPFDDPEISGALFWRRKDGTRSGVGNGWFNTVKCADDTDNVISIRECDENGGNYTLVGCPVAADASTQVTQTCGPNNLGETVGNWGCVNDHGLPHTERSCDQGYWTKVLQGVTTGPLCCDRNDLVVSCTVSDSGTEEDQQICPVNRVGGVATRLRGIGNWRTFPQSHANNYCSTRGGQTNHLCPDASNPQGGTHGYAVVPKNPVTDGYFKLCCDGDTGVECTVPDSVDPVETESPPRNCGTGGQFTMSLDDMDTMCGGGTVTGHPHRNANNFDCTTSTSLSMHINDQNRTPHDMYYCCDLTSMTKKVCDRNR